MVVVEVKSVETPALVSRTSRVNGRRASRLGPGGRQVGVVLAGLILFDLAGCDGSSRVDYPRQSLDAGADNVAFVDESACTGCHVEQAAAWRGSHHERAMQRATAETVAGDFDDATFTHGGVTTRFRRSGSRFLVETEGRAGGTETYEVLYTFGIEPLQQYLVAFLGGRLQALDVAWDTQRNTWFALRPDERVLPGDPLHWTGRYNRWNDRCAECHSTDLRVRYDAETDSYATTWAAVNVGCQACHGPGARHVEWAEQTAPAADGTSGTAMARPSAPADSGARSGRSSHAQDVGLLVDLHADRAEQTWTCAPCHSLRSRASAEDAHGRSYHDDFRLALLRADHYHADGQIREEVYVTGSFLQSLMHRRGVVCGDCHDPHSAATLSEGNALCTRCHQARPPASFLTLRAQEYDSPAHHHHEAGTAGATCVECHMPARPYMVVDPRRDHSLRVPRPDLSVKLGTPNACTMCHTDRTDAWAAAAIDGWFMRRARPWHYGEAIAAGRARGTDGESQLLRLAADTSQPGIARATALELLGGYDGVRATDAIAASLSDPDPLIRLAGVEAMARRPPDTQSTTLVPLLDDSIGSIRSAAARILAPQRRAITDGGTRAALDRALDAYRSTQVAQVDQPESSHNLADLAAAVGDLSGAERGYARAIDLDSTFIPAHVNLANLYNQLGRNAEAEALLRRAVTLAPEQGELHYSLGLLLAEMERMADAANALSRAAELLPDRARVHYNRGLALQVAGQVDDAESALQRAWQLDRSEPAFVTALAFFYREAGRWDEASRHAERLVELLPGDASARRLLDEIRARRDDH